MHVYNKSVQYARATPEFILAHRQHNIEVESQDSNTVQIRAWF